MIYWHSLVVVSLAFVVLERLLPRRSAQGLVRPGLATDLFYAVFSGHVLGLLLAQVTQPVAAAFDGLLARAGVPLHLGLLRGWHPVAQFAVVFVVMDLLQWAVHVLLHHVPALWELHRVHHSIVHMDFWGSLRFHFGEVVVYKSLLYVPAAWLGADAAPLFWVAVVSTAIGHLNHANLRVRYGPLRYLLNGPEMHLWHHAHDAPRPHGVNFAINLAVWDWLFGTAFWPADGRDPARLGFPGIERFPQDPLRQQLWPLSRALVGARRAAPADGRAASGPRPRAGQRQDAA
jgi:sterol desaturase/sphingolipid hydroxylase (fatty acid hydroxylase superfamily)